MRLLKLLAVTACLITCELAFSAKLPDLTLNCGASVRPGSNGHIADTLFSGQIKFQAGISENVTVFQTENIVGFIGRGDHDVLCLNVYERATKSLGPKVASSCGAIRPDVGVQLDAVRGEKTFYIGCDL